MSTPDDRASSLNLVPTSFTYARARAAGISDRRLRQLVDDHTLVRIGRGVYRRADAAPADEDLLEIAHRVPDATLCLVTALARHELTDRIPDRIDVALPRRRRSPRVTALVRWHRFDELTFALGRDALAIDDGLTIGLYSPERCVIDAFRLRHLEGEEVAVEALRRWLRQSGATPATLLSMARAFPKAEPAVRDALRILL